ncbi:PIN domain-containing protein [Thermococcus sp.]|uniref:PIN domain-containing protein n=1 Tax=Thermococcus sp. TaxID=35749 RepID=UPI002630EF75|nr:PIN domain-containing protein [Thermococcus sp.]
MEIVLDFNVVFSALYGGRVSREIFTLNHVVREVTFLVPAYFWEEFEGKKEKLLKITKLTENELNFVLRVIKSQTVEIPPEIFSGKLGEAEKLSPDPKDVPYVALAMALEIPLLTGDLKLREKIEGELKVYSPSELLAVLKEGLL